MSCIQHLNGHVLHFLIQGEMHLGPDLDIWMISYLPYDFPHHSSPDVTKPLLDSICTIWYELNLVIKIQPLDMSFDSIKQCHDVSFESVVTLVHS